MTDTRAAIAAPNGGDEAARVRELSDRKRFLKLAGGASAVGLFGFVLAACGGDDDSTSGGTGTSDSGNGASAGDLEILNYALTLEFLEAKFYKDVIDSGVIEDQALADVAKTFGDEEQEHVDALTATIEQLGGTPADDPNGNFDDVIGGGAETVLMTAAVVENLGAAAYLGQAGRIESPDVLAAALSIHTVEARHAAALNAAAGLGFSTGNELEGSIPDGAFGVPMDMAAVLKAVKPYLPTGK